MNPDQSSISQLKEEEIHQIIGDAMNKLNQIVVLMALLTVGYSQDRNRQLAFSATLQALDYITTTQGIQSGMVERNPIMKSVVHRPVPFVGVKPAVYFGTTAMDTKSLKWFNLFYLALIINNAHALSRAN